MKFTIFFRTLFASSFLLSYANSIQSQEGELVFEEVIVTAEKREKLHFYQEIMNALICCYFYGKYNKSKI